MRKYRQKYYIMKKLHLMNECLKKQSSFHFGPRNRQVKGLSDKKVRKNEKKMNKKIHTDEKL